VKSSSPLPDPADESPIAETNAKTPPSLLHRARAFVSRNGDALLLEAIGDVALAIVVSLLTVASPSRALTFLMPTCPARS
jgi:hypothetical protein